MIRLFVGFDPREAIGYHVFVSSVHRHASQPVSITALDSKGLPEGSNSFTLSRFLVPYLCGYRGHAIFADGSDMLATADISELDALFNPQYAVQVVKRPDYQSRHERKYIGTSMECEQSNYSRKNWASVMIVNCEHPAWWSINPDTIRASKPLDLLQLKFCQESIGDLNPRWNVLVDEGEYGDESGILHWTAGSPAFPHYQNAPSATLWAGEALEMLKV